MRLEAATLAHVWSHGLARHWHPQPFEYRLVVAETLAGRVWAGVVSDGTPLVLGGCLAVPGEPGCFWLSVAPGCQTRMLPAVRGMRAQIAIEAGRHPGGVVAYVRDDNMAGRRLAQLCGFEEGEPAGGVRREWRRQA